MGRLGASDQNANANANASLHGGGVAMHVRFNSQELLKVRKPGFPFEPTPAEKPTYDAAQNAVNNVKFREYWDAELRASVYLNAFLTAKPDRVSTLIDAINKERLHDQLHEKKGEQLRKVVERSDEREERFGEIIDQHDGDGAIKYWLGMLMVDAASAPATYQLIRVARRIGEVVVMCLKDHYREPRPSQICPAIMPLIDPPVTPAFPAGHALQAHLISLCLEAAERPRVQREMLFELSRRVAENRVIAGLHYPLDNDAGVLAANKCFELMRGSKKFQVEEFKKLGGFENPEALKGLEELSEFEKLLAKAWVEGEREARGLR
jgi:PAP2 superfamily